MTIVCRGPKPQIALKRHGLSAGLVTVKPHTTQELLDALATTNLDGARHAAALWGRNVRSPTRCARGALVEDVCLYEWVLPEDLGPLHEVVRRAIAGEVDALLFTSQVQFRYPARDRPRLARGSLVAALNEHVIVGAVGPVCAAALRAGGVVPDVLPASPNSASLVGAVADYFELTARRSHLMDPEHLPRQMAICPRSSPASRISTSASCSGCSSVRWAGSSSLDLESMRGSQGLIVAVPIFTGRCSASRRLLSDRSAAGASASRCSSFSPPRSWAGWRRAACRRCSRSAYARRRRRVVRGRPAAGQPLVPPERQGLVMGIAAAGNSGTVIANLVAPRLATAGGMAQRVRPGARPAGAGARPVLAAWPRTRRGGATIRTRAEYLAAVAHPDTWWFCFFYSVTFGGYVGLSSFLPVFLRDQFSVSPVTAGS